MRDQRYAERNRRLFRPQARTFRMFNDSGREVDPCRKGGHRCDDGHASGRTGGSRDPQSEKRNVTGHEGRKNLTQGKEADRVDSSRRNCQRVEQQIANRDFGRLIVNLCDEFGLHNLSRIRAGSAANHRRFGIRDFREHGLVDIQVCPHQFMRRKLQPLRQ